MFDWLQRMGQWLSGLASTAGPVELARDERPTLTDVPALAVAAGRSGRSTPAPGTEQVSSTRWFMSALDPEQLAQSEGEALDFHTVETMSDRYTARERLPDALRKAWSLDGE